MSEQISDAQAAAGNKKDLLKVKRAGQTCITFFVVFAISLLAFGKAPVARITGTDGYRVNYNVFSCLGVAMGFFAVLFLATNLRRILRVPAATKVLGLVGCFGLIVHTVFALLLPLSYGAGAAPAAGLAGRQPLAWSGPEEWAIDGKACKISSTYYLELPEGLQYTIEYPWQFTPADRNMNDERALTVAFPLMKHAYTNGLYQRASITKLGQGVLRPSRIGVVLVEKDAGNVRGYKVALSLDQIRKRIEQAPASRPAIPSNPTSGPR